MYSSGMFWNCEWLYPNAGVGLNAYLLASEAEC